FLGLVRVGLDRLFVFGRGRPLLAGTEGRGRERQQDDEERSHGGGRVAQAVPPAAGLGQGVTDASGSGGSSRAHSSLQAAACKLGSVMCERITSDSDSSVMRSEVDWFDSNNWRKPGLPLVTSSYARISAFCMISSFPLFCPACHSDAAK